MINFFQNQKKFKVIAFLLLVSITITGCATLFKGSSEKVSFNSDPVGAQVYVNGQLMGTTPMQIKLESKKSYTIEFRKEGFAPRVYQISNSIAAGYLILDILGGLIPVIIDAATGAWYTLDQDNINAMLEKQK